MLIFDLETDGFLSQATSIHCLAIHDTDTEQTVSYNDKGNQEPVVRGVQRLEDADCIAGYNIIGLIFLSFRNSFLGLAGLVLLAILYFFQDY